LLGGAFLRHGHTDQPCAVFDRLGKRKPVMAHHKSNDISMLAAAETMEKALVVIDREAWGFLVVKWTASDEFAASSDQLDPFADDFGNRQTGANLVDEARRNLHACDYLPLLARQVFFCG